MSLLTRTRERFCRQPQLTTIETLQLIPSPSDLEIRAILTKHDCCPMIPNGAINVRPISFKDAVGRRVHQLTWREVNQFKDDPLSDGRPKVGLVQLKIDTEYATYLASLGLPTRHFKNETQAERYIFRQQRTGF